MKGRWLVPWHPRPHERRTLLCLAPAGAGCGQFRGWQPLLGDDVSVIGVQLPGREARWADPPASTVDEVITSIVVELVELVPVDLPLVVFGQSFGGLLGYEVTRRLGGTFARWPAALVVVACRPPHMWVDAGRGLVADDEELERLLDVRGLGADELDEDSRELMIEVLRQDARLSLTYTDPHGAAVHTSLHAWGGVQDGTVTGDQLDGWRRYSANGFHRRDFVGGHYFCMERVEQVVSALRDLAGGEGAR